MICHHISSHIVASLPSFLPCLPPSLPTAPPAAFSKHTCDPPSIHAPSLPTKDRQQGQGPRLIKAQHQAHQQGQGPRNAKDSWICNININIELCVILSLKNINIETQTTTHTKDTFCMSLGMRATCFCLDRCL